MKPSQLCLIASVLTVLCCSELYRLSFFLIALRLFSVLLGRLLHMPSCAAFLKKSFVGLMEFMRGLYTEDIMSRPSVQLYVSSQPGDQVHRDLTGCSLARPLTITIQRRQDANRLVRLTIDSVENFGHRCHTVCWRIDNSSSFICW
jgi:hypothetical protein